MIIPRALLWAICVVAFQAVCRIHADKHLKCSLWFIISTEQVGLFD